MMSFVSFVPGTAGLVRQRRSYSRVTCKIEVRDGQQGDAPAVRRMVWKEKMNPLAVNDMSTFAVAVDDEGGQIVGCVQLRHCGGGERVRELASLVVDEKYRRRGISRSLMGKLLTSQEADNVEIFLLCPSFRDNVYKEFGFKRVPWGALPTSMMKVEYALGQVVSRFVLGTGIIPMRRSPLGL
eukprot:CAMPEP_0198730850 /NCGR_PEP_ID=MMETSP1475-20131203/26663_1 /TAXON_ID= ORGANISM="Unidentified sp., Strain CCMP1999" /NCGR_SAMPLE_ID=MMETSP1475 /ASSEMBLY_ACC=CAM_ASM_001111 /LENGTH=182 /DNA_ID=CAMNT_0044493717 /DNA_START=71 /DNA_END=619 /DNA_ORIENTATION=-